MKTYDIVIVGAGTAGCALANRLSESPERSILLVEAGEDLPPVEERPPVLRDDYGRAAQAASFVWSYPGRFTRGQSESTVVRGRVVGGSGAINGAMFVRGLPEDYDGWGAPEWTYDALDRAFARAEAPFAITTHAERARMPFHEAFRCAARDAGFPAKPDVGVPQGSGVGAIRLNSVNGVRVTAADSHLAPARGRKNLELLTGTLILEILLDDRVAAGIVVRRGDGGEETIRAREIILCAGGVATPALLLRSGLGEPAELEAAGIRPVYPLRGVGRNLSDHPIAVIDAVPVEGQTPQGSDPRFQIMLQYTATGSPWRNDMHLFPSSVAPSEGDPMGGLRIDDASWRIYACMQRAVARGRVTLRPKDGELQPFVEFRYLEHEQDRARLREAVRLGVRLLAHPAFAPLVAERRTPQDHVLDSDDNLDDWLTATVASAQHSSGTCRMGRHDDPDAVVDSHGRVHGVRGLRVADLSIAPEVVRAPTQVTALMIAERIAELIEREASSSSVGGRFQ